MTGDAERKDGARAHTRRTFEPQWRSLQVMTLVGGLAAAASLLRLLETVGALRGVRTDGLFELHLIVWIVWLFLPGQWYLGAVKNAHALRGERRSGVPGRLGQPIVGWPALAAGLAALEGTEENPRHALTLLLLLGASAFVTGLVGDLAQPLLRMPAFCAGGLSALAVVLGLLPIARRIARRQEREHRAQR